MLQVNKDKFNPEDTRVLWNRKIISREIKFSMKRPVGKKPIELFKQVFGPQLKTWIGGSEARRFYIWTFKFEHTLLYAMVHNVKGICWEYPIDTDKSNLDKLHKIIYKQLNISLSKK